MPSHAGALALASHGGPGLGWMMGAPSCEKLGTGVMLVRLPWRGQDGMKAPAVSNATDPPHRLCPPVRCSRAPQFPMTALTGTREPLLVPVFRFLGLGGGHSRRSALCREGTPQHPP